MIALGVTFLVAIVLLGIYGLRVRAARLKQAEHGIARLEDALRETDATIGRVESEIAAVTDVVKASLTPPEPAKASPKPARLTALHHVFADEQAGPVLRYHLAAALADACPFSRVPSTELLEAEFLRSVRKLFSYARGREHQKWLLLLTSARLAADDVSLLYPPAGPTSRPDFLETWECAMRGSSWDMAKTPKGRMSVLSHYGESGY